MTDPNPTVFDWNFARIAHRDNLPHVRQPNVIYFVTFRLGDSLPAERVAPLKLRRDDWLRLNPPPHTPEQENEYRHIWTVRIERLMDAGYGACVLRNPRCRQMLEANLRHDDAVRYRLGDFVIMPNHVHALLQILPGHDLGETMKAWKSVSARNIGRHLGRTGSYWMDEYFDHAVRSGLLQRYVRYIRRNSAHLPPDTFTLGCGTLGSQDIVP
jgi:putative transposase